MELLLSRRNCWTGQVYNGFGKDSDDCCFECVGMRMLLLIIIIIIIIIIMIMIIMCRFVRWMNDYGSSDDITLVVVRFPSLPASMSDEKGDWKKEPLM